jgi:uncharacterized repeat protein (TIGR01451 family)
MGGYAVTLTSDNPTNLTADFGFGTRTDPGPEDPILTVAKTDNKTSVKPGDTLTYQITVTNIAPDSMASENVVVTDLLPDGLNYVSSSHSGVYDPDTHSVTWTIPLVAYGSPVILSVDAKVKSDIDKNITRITNLVTLDHSDCNLTGSLCLDDDTNSINHPPVPPTPPGTNPPTPPLPPNTGVSLQKASMLLVTILVLGGIVAVGTNRAMKLRRKNGLDA